MNLNVIAYSIYLLITIVIIVHVGKVCYRNGNVYVAELIPDHLDLCHTTNKILLLGYYLMNIGYCAMTLISWQKIIGLTQMIEIIALKTSCIIALIAVMHYLNIYLLTKYIQKLI